MPVKFTFFMEQKTYGWSESFYQDRVDLGLNFVLDATNVATARAALLGAQGRVSYARISTTQTVAPETALVSFVGGGSSGLSGNAALPSDHPDTALLLRFNNLGNTKAKLMYLRGQPDSLVDAGGIYVPTAAWATVGTTWLNALKTAQMGWLARGLKARIGITAVDTLPSGQLRYTLAAAFFAAPSIGKSVVCNIKGARGATNINGSQTVVITSTTTCESLRPIPTFAYQGGATMTTWTQQFFPIETFRTLRAVERKAGRPSYQSPGRRRVRRVG